MKNLMRIAALLLAISLLLCLCACDNEPDPEITTASTTASQDDQPEDQTTVPNTTVAPEPDYTVTVVDEGGNPVANAWVQVCIEDGTCTPASTDKNGVAAFYVAEYNYKVSFMVMPDGYDYATEQDTWYFEDGKTEMTIVLKAVG